MNEQLKNQESLNQFDENGSKPNDLVDGWAITTVLSIIVAGILYYLYTM